MSVVRLEPLGAEGQPGGLTVWEHSYATAPFKAAQALSHLVLHRSNGNFSSTHPDDGQ
jgi:hypothetical protein